MAKRLVKFINLLDSKKISEEYLQSHLKFNKDDYNNIKKIKLISTTCSLLCRQ